MTGVLITVVDGGPWQRLSGSLDVYYIRTVSFIFKASSYMTYRCVKSSVTSSSWVMQLPDSLKDVHSVSVSVSDDRHNPQQLPTNGLVVYNLPVGYLQEHPLATVFLFPASYSRHRQETIDERGLRRNYRAKQPLASALPLSDYRVPTRLTYSRCQPTSTVHNHVYRRYPATPTELTAQSIMHNNVSRRMSIGTHDN